MWGSKLFVPPSSLPVLTLGAKEQVLDESCVSGFHFGPVCEGLKNIGAYTKSLGLQQKKGGARIRSPPVLLPVPGCLLAPSHGGEVSPRVGRICLLAESD